MTTTKTVTLGTITKRAYTVIPTVVTKTKTLTCRIPRRQPHRDPWARITPTVAFAAALETGQSTASATATGAPRGRRDAFRRVAEDRAEFLAAREARLAGAVVEKRGLDNATATVTELDTAKWVASTSWATAPATTVTMSTEATTSVTTTSTSTVYSGVTKVLITVTAVSLAHLSISASCQMLIHSRRLHPQRQRPSTPLSRPRLRSRSARQSLSPSRRRPHQALLSARQRVASWSEQIESPNRMDAIFLFSKRELMSIAWPGQRVSILVSRVGKRFWSIQPPKLWLFFFSRRRIFVMLDQKAHFGHIYTRAL